MSRPVHAAAAHVADRLISRGHPGVIQHRAPTATEPAQTAAALHVAVGAIVVARVMLLDDEPVLFLLSAVHEMTVETTGKRLEATLAPADDEMVALATGQPIDAIAPVGHPTDLATYVDEQLAEHPVLWACAGHREAVFRTTYPELLRITAGLAVDVS